MKTYIVGGAVRDALLGLPVQDRDHVVVGATPDEMLALGFTPVGKDFPVFLHPVTHEEYALARTERKTAPGYKGFLFHAAPEVTLEQDLVRRDLTINAMAQDESGQLIDPFHGQRDLQARVFRHVSPAFIEDPVRILRVARFAARFTAFVVAPETRALMQRMVEAGEIDALVPERVWQELARGLMEQAPGRMFDVLRDCGALGRLLPELESHWADTEQQGEASLSGKARALQRAARQQLSVPVRCAILLQDLGAAAIDAIAKRLRIPNDCRELALLAAREGEQVEQAQKLDAEALVNLLARADALRKPQRFLELLQAQACRHATTTAESFLPGVRLEQALATARAVDAGAVARQCAADPRQIPQAVHQARVAAVDRMLQSA